MKILDSVELKQVAGGDSVESNLGAGAAIVIHGVTSAEGQAFGLVSPIGWVVGAFVHYATSH